MKRSLCALFVSIAASGCTGIIDVTESGGPSGNGPGGSGVPGPGSGSGGGGGSTDPTDPGTVTIPGGVTLSGEPVFYRVVRLTHEQWENSVRDTLRLPGQPGLSSGFIPDPPDGRFSNNERALYVTNSLRTDYQRAAETLSEAVTRDPAALARLTTASDGIGLIRDVGRRLFRRPLSAEEEQRYLERFDGAAAIIASGNAFADGAQLVIEAMLQSPYFLYRTELTPNGSRLSGYELATKLSLLLRNTAPDDALLEAAQSGQLDTPAGLTTIVEQLLNTSAAASVLEHFHDELYGLHRYGSIDKDPTAFPAYSQSLNATLLQADLRFFGRVFSSGLGLREILGSPVAYVNQATAGFYGLSASGSELSEVTLDQSRPGFLTRLGFLAYNASLRDPDPIHRGVDINDRVLCAHLAPPPGVIPALPELVPGQTNRERVTAHTGPGTCGASCHGQIINPLGFAFESFDAIGQARSTDNGKPVDTSGEYAFNDGVKAFSNVRELVSLLMESDQAHGCYAARLTEFTMARDLAGGDGDLVTYLQKNSMDQDASIKELLLALATRAEFSTAKGGAP